MEPKTIFLFEHGIANIPSNWRSWVNRAITHIDLNTPVQYHARGLFYFTTAFTVWMRERAREEAFCRFFKAYTSPEWRIIIVAHSNGAGVALGGLRRAHWP